MTSKPSGVVTRTTINALCGLALVWTSATCAEEHSAIGGKIAEYAAKITSVTYEKDRTILNLESDGVVGDYGTVHATATLMHPIAQNPPTGVYNHRGARFHPDGSVMTFTGRGTWKALGKHRWRIDSVGLAADGSRTFSVGVLELDTRSMKGSVYALD